jgi:hypothetical protein
MTSREREWKRIKNDLDDDSVGKANARESPVSGDYRGRVDQWPAILDGGDEWVPPEDSSYGVGPGRRR